MKKVLLSVPDMSCGHCVSSISDVLKKIDGIENFNVILDSKTVELVLKEGDNKLDFIIESLDDIGFSSTIKH